MTTEKKALPKRWTADEEAELLKLVKQDKSPEEIAKALGRTVGGPQIRLGQIAVRMIQEEGKTLPVVCDLTGLKEEEVDKQLTFANKKKGEEYVVWFKEGQFPGKAGLEYHKQKTGFNLEKARQEERVRTKLRGAPSSQELREKLKREGLPSSAVQALGYY
ncbi:MAG: hypothetical protein GY845_30580 [Planctomycetes bacterium]|nr:hypothetical protein [Planctomycetota bacterium]